MITPNTRSWNKDARPFKEKLRDSMLGMSVMLVPALLIALLAWYFGW